MASPAASRRPKLSLQTKPTTSSQVRSRKSALANADPRSPTTFNTLSNVYLTAIERSTPVQSTPLTAINTQQPLRLQTNLVTTFKDHQHEVQSPFATMYPDTPLSADAMSPIRRMDIVFPSQQMTATPPLSAGPTESSGPKPFSFASPETSSGSIGCGGGVPQSTGQARRRAVYSSPFGPGAAAKAPYSHNRSLHSILRNSPLPPPSARSPVSPRRQSRRPQGRAARRVGYESPLTQTITTEKYTRSHIDLLVEEEPPPAPATATTSTTTTTTTTTVGGPEMTLDLAMAYYPGGETRDGGQTPGPFEEMRRRMTALGTGAASSSSSSSSPVLSPRSDGVRKRSGGRRKERERERGRRRRWVWTIGSLDDGGKNTTAGSDNNNNNNNNNSNKDDDNVEGGGKEEEEEEAEEESGAMRAIREAAAAECTPRATRPPARSLPLPLFVRTEYGEGPGGTPEPVTAVQISVEELLPEESDSDPDSAAAVAAASASDRTMDVEMSGTESGPSSRATTPYNNNNNNNNNNNVMDLDIDIATPTAATATATAMASVLKIDTTAPAAREGRLEFTDLVNPETAGGRRDTPIPPDLV